MQTINPANAGGELKPASSENKPVFSLEKQAEIAAALKWFEEAAEFAQRLHAKYGDLPDCTAIVTEDRRRDG